MQKSIVFIAVVFKGESLHVFKGDFSFIVSIENTSEGSDIGSCWVKLFIHRPVKIHEHFSCSNGLQNAIFIIVIHFKYFSSFIEHVPGKFETSLSAKESSIFDFGDLIIE